MLKPKQLKFYGLNNFESIPQIQKLSEDEKFALQVVANILPFRTNNYLVEELINWDNIPNDPIYKLTFMHQDMLSPPHYEKMANALKNALPKDQIKKIADEIRWELNPHPSGQIKSNIPKFNEEPISGLQHKYKETVLIFPSSGQTCHSYCTFCFRWAQFVGIDDLKFATDQSKQFQAYIQHNKEITDVLLTGGDPMVMSVEKLKVYTEPFLQPEFDHIRNIRIGTKSLSYWPYRYVTDKDSDDILRLFEKIINTGKHLTLMAHFSHHNELSTEIVQTAIKRLLKIGVTIRTQSPVIKYVNDDPLVWSKMWEDQVKLGLIPYYMFVERDTGPKHYFELPLSKVHQIYREAIKKVSGISRTARGPVMSAHPGKIIINGISEIRGEKVFVLSFIQGRQSSWVQRPFFAKYDENATWFDQLKPTFGKERFFFQEKPPHLPQFKKAVPTIKFA